MATAPISRRRFLRNSAFAAAPLIVPGRVLGRDGGVAPSNRIRFGVIGIGPRARDTMPTFLSFPETSWAAVSDCRADRLQHAKEMVDKHYGNTDCRAYPDFQEMLARPDIDAVMIATGNRWHGLASIYAARAGKDIYCEKPVTLSVREGRELAETCRRFGVVYQAGTQRRATASYRFARDLVRQGRIGRLHTIEMQVWEGAAIPHQDPAPVPAGWDYDRWLGQAPWRPFTPGRANAWQYFWDTADGMLTDMGAHYTDQAQWVLGTDHTGPVHFEGNRPLPRSREVHERHAPHRRGPRPLRRRRDRGHVPARRLRPTAPSATSATRAGCAWTTTPTPSPPPTPRCSTCAPAAGPAGPTPPTTSATSSTASAPAARPPATPRPPTAPSPSAS
jgi:predicted dehydrogenase